MTTQPAEALVPCAAVCHGTEGVWGALGGLMGMSPDDYVCNCGPTSAPGNPLYDRDRAAGA